MSSFKHEIEKLRKGINHPTPTCREDVGQGETWPHSTRIPKLRLRAPNIKTADQTPKPLSTKPSPQKQLKDPGEPKVQQTAFNDDLCSIEDTLKGIPSACFSLCETTLVNRKALLKYFTQHNYQNDDLNLLQRLEQFKKEGEVLESLFDKTKLIQGQLLDRLIYSIRNICTPNGIPTHHGQSLEETCEIAVLKQKLEDCEMHSHEVITSLKHQNSELNRKTRDHEMKARQVQIKNKDLSRKLKQQEMQLLQLGDSKKSLRVVGDKLATLQSQKMELEDKLEELQKNMEQQVSSLSTQNTELEEQVEDCRENHEQRLSEQHQQLQVLKSLNTVLTQRLQACEMERQQRCREEPPAEGNNIIQHEDHEMNDIGGMIKRTRVTSNWKQVVLLKDAIHKLELQQEHYQLQRTLHEARIAELEKILM